MSASAWLDPVRAALDALARPVDVFFHDDRAGCRDDRLDTLLGLFSDRGLVCDVAVSPDALDRSTVSLLTGWALVDGMRLHQHGGQDVAAGRALLRRELGALLDDVLTPGDQGCTPGLAGTLVPLGITTLVRQAGAAPLRVPGLVERTVTVDWPRPAGTGRTRELLGRDVAAAVAGPGAVGIGLHHVTADRQQMDAVAALLGLLACHPGACPTTITQLAGTAPAPVVPRTDPRPEYYDSRTLSCRPSR